VRDWTLAVDFGTSFTTAAMFHDGVVEVLDIEKRRYLPSTVSAGDEGELLTGIAAEQLAAQRPDRAERLPKRALVAGDSVLLGGRAVTSVDLVAAVLRRVYTEALGHHRGVAPARLVLTHPAAWPAHEQALLLKAAQAAGLGPVDLVPEPVAAAVHYTRVRADEIPVGGHVAVYDLGGGTFDTAVVRRTRDGFVLAGPPGGDPHLGGEDFDEALLEIVGRHARERDPAPWDTLWADQDAARRYQLATLRRDATAAKEALSSTATVYLTVPGYDDVFVIGRAEFESAVEEHLQRSLDLLERTVRDAGVPAAELSAVLLAGGASATPRVSDLLAERLGGLPVMDPDPKLVVVRGALFAGAAAEPSSPEATAAPPPLRFNPDRSLFDE